MTQGFSIVICTFNGSSRLGDVLRHLNILDIPAHQNWEVVLVDNASTDNTYKWLQEIISLQSWPCQISVIQEHRPGLNFARLAGVSHASFDWVLFCDDDNLLDTQYIRYWFELVSLFPEIGCVGGKGIAMTEHSFPHWFADYGHSYAVGPQLPESGFVPYGGALYGAGLFVNKTPILNLINSGFELIMSDRASGKLSSGGDLEWCYLIQLSGLKLYYDERMTFHHQISKDRLVWPYYIRLKSGIASGTGLLAPYQFVFAKGYKSEFYFVLTYLLITLKSIMVFLYVQLKYVLKSRRRLDVRNDLALAILREKAVSYFSNMQTAYKHYSRLYKQFSATV